MSRSELIVCDCCGSSVAIADWVVLPTRRTLVFPLMFNRTGTAFFDVCGRTCEFMFRQYCIMYYKEDIFEYKAPMRGKPIAMED